MNDKLAGFWRRILAYGIDVFLVAIVFGIVNSVYLSLSGRDLFLEWDGMFSSGSLGVNFLFFVPYFAITIGVWNKTVGMKLLGLYAVCEGDNNWFVRKGDEVGIIRALMRAIMMTLIASPFVGCLLIPFRKDKQALHDWICGTVVYVKGRVKEDTEIA